MVSPPGRDPDVSHWSVVPPVDDHMKDAVGDLAAWVDYLLTPDSHDGPRIHACQHPGCDYVFRWHKRDPTIENNPSGPLYTHTVGANHLEGFQAESVLRGLDPHHFFYAASALSGMWQEAPGGIAAVYELLCVKFLLNGATKDKEQDTYFLQEVPVPEGRETIRDDLAFMRKPWLRPHEEKAYVYEKDIVDFAIGHEACMYVLAEALAKYRAIFLEARNHVRDLMNELTERFDQMLKESTAPTPVSINWYGLVFTGIVNAVITVATGGQNAVLAGAIALAADAVTKVDGATEIEGSDWAELSKSFFDKMDSIGDDVFMAVGDLNNKLAAQLDKIKADWGAQPPAVPAELLQFAK
ncbi:hypothetical protein [Actinosynnema sp. ALI-1.44]|uniref:hypothetical protein n=1 Tax=Actinosynnema sp. ALI-1.44 TaxID=1933779 RepID=UPI0011781B21|nr:hypothetical protein [Actinosynnema sp. ALI-1.44]